MKRNLLWTALALAVLLLLGSIFGFRVWLRQYLASEAFRQRLDGQVSRIVGANGEFTPLAVDSLDSIYADSFIARDGAVFDRFQADQIRADLHFGFLARTAVLERLEVARVQARLADPSNRPASSAAPPSASPAPGSRWMTSFSLRQAVIQQFDLSWLGGRVEGAYLQITPSGSAPGEWLFEGSRGKVVTEVGPEWRVESFSGRQRGDAFYLHQARLRSGERGEGTLEGTFALGRPPEARATFSGVELAPLLPGDWRARLTGQLAGKITLKGAPGEGGVSVASGEFTLSDGKLHAFPFLEQVATITRTERFRRVELHEARAQVTQLGRPGDVRIEHLVVESNGLFKVEGELTLREGKIDGVVQLGVTPASLEWIPGAESKVFTASREGYLWTPVRLSGSAAHPQEDLSARLAQAAVNQTVESVPENVRGTLKDAIDTVAPLLPVPIPSLPGL
ncbi:MAG TPA: hypothetical protein VNQ90_01570 [Chthoniobacteraceae bacterium]|nr:hypothetical protein [Chthoniobacteraceae bacterium]